MSQKISTRQLRQHTVLPMIGNSADEAGDSVLSKIDAQSAKLFEDRNILLTDGGIVTFTGTSVQFTEALNLVINQKISGAAPQIISLAATTRSVSANNRMIYAVINRTAGTATVTDDATTLPAAASANQEVFLIAKRIDATDGTQRLYFRNGAAFNAGQSARLGSAGSGSGGSGTGDDLDSLTFKASFTDLFDDIPTAANAAVDTTAGKTDATLYSAVNALFQLNYDASKTVTTVGTAATLSGTPAFTVKAGDMLIAGGNARRIATATTQTSYVLESAFPTDVTTVQATVSQAVHSKDLNNFAADGNAISAAFSTSINQVMAIYEDTTTAGDKIFDVNVAPVVGFTASSDGTNYTPVQVRPTLMTDSVSIVSLPTSSTSLYMRLFANKTSGTGTVNVLGYKVFFHRDAQVQDGTLLNQSSCLTNGQGTQVNVSSISVVGGKTRLKKTWAFPVGVNSGTANGSLKVYLNGQKIPRFVSATATPDAYYTEIDQNTIQLDSDYSSMSLLLEVIQDIAVIDNSDINSSALNQAQESSSEGFQGFIKSSQLMNATSTPGTPSAGTFYSSVINRSAISDLSQDLKTRMGVERLVVQNIYLISGEAGSNGETVYGVLGDDRNQIRLVGAFSLTNLLNYGNFIASGANTTDYVEITFYGTGLNILNNLSSSGYDFRASVDGGTETGNLTPLTYSGVLAQRNYASNQVVPIVNNLTLGVHTVRIRQNVSGSFGLFAFEVLNESSSLRINPGTSYINSKKLTLNTQQTSAYNSGFESGTLGTRGGRVIVYQKADGSIAKAVQPTDASQANLASANHQNEEVVRPYNFRELGAGRTDDFSFTNNSATARAFTLEDGVTSLVSDSATSQVTGGESILASQANGSFITFTFVGTGLDFTRIDSANSAIDTYTISIDGSSIGTLTGTGSTTKRIQKVVSGLPYGTHVFKMVRSTAVGQQVTIGNFIVYQPKKPSVPSGAVELADYNIMADFVANTTAGTDTIATGVLRKMASREFIYVNGTGGTSDWSINTPDSSSPGGLRLTTDRLNAFVEYTFFGTGFEIRQQSQSNGAANATISLNGSTLNTTNFPTLASSAYGTGVTFNAATGVADFADAATTAGSGIRVSNLPLAKYTVRITNGTAAQFIRWESFDVITPIHSYKPNMLFDLQNTGVVGNCGISDNRAFTPVKDKGLLTKSSAKATGVSSGPTTTSTVYIPCPDMSVVVRSQNGGKLKINGYINWRSSVINGYGFFVVYINGIQVGIDCGGQTYAATADMMSYINETVYVGPGVYKVDIYWRTATGTLTAQSVGRNLTVEES